MALFDGDVEPGFQIPVDGGEGNRDVERDVVAVGQYGFGVGADFVGDFTGAAEGAVAADDDEVDAAALHQVSGGAVGDDLMGNALLGEFPGGEGGALGARAGFVAKDVEFFALGLGGVERSGGAADIDEGEPAGVAMGEHVHAFANELRTVASDVLAMADIFAGKLLSGGEGQCLLFLDCFAGAHGGANAVHSVDGVHGGGASGFEGLINCGDVAEEVGEGASGKGACALGQAVSGGGADGAGSADDHIGDGARGLVEVVGGDDLEFVREEPLLNQQHRIVVRVKGDRAVVTAPSEDGNVHGD